MDMLKAVVIISVIPALIIMVLNSFVRAFFDMPSYVGIIDRIKLIGRNIA